LIVDELLTKPSGVCPMLFVGLGGAGCKMVARIAHHLRRRPDFRERYRALIKFAMVDTNVNDLESYRETADATFLISDFEKEEYANLASGKKFLEPDEYFTQWVPSDYRFRSGDTSGAGQIRIESRLGVYYQMKHKDFVPRFRSLLEQLKSHEHGHRKLDSDEIRIVLCYSLAGGTGSGCHLPVAYMLRDQAKDLGRPNLIGAAVMPAVFEDRVGVNKDGVFANGYAALKETEHLMKLGAPDSRFFPKDGLTFHYNPADPSRRKAFTRPFELLYLIDKPESFSVPDPVDAAADGLYLQFFSPLYGAQLSDYDNYTQYQRFLVPDDFEEQQISGFSTFYGSFGSAVLLVPVPGLVEYCSQAAALALIRASFMGAIPPGPVYERLRMDRDNFDEVKEQDTEDAQIFRAAEISNQEDKQRRERLIDRLFLKRIRLLAACEHDQHKMGRFLSVFRHGHYLGSVPDLKGNALYRPDLHAEDIQRERELVSGRLSASIGGILLPALVGMPGEDPEFLQRAQAAIQQYQGINIPREMRVSDLKRRGARWREELKAEALRRLRDGYSEGNVRVPGMEDLVEFRFLRREAGGVDLTAKRYAVLCLLEAVDWSQAVESERESDFDVQGAKDTKKLRKENDAELIDHVLSQARALAFHDVQREFRAQLGTLEKALRGYAERMRELERGSVTLEREYERRLDSLRFEGEESSNQYVLDAEALQGEDGRRFWDFYFEDKIADLPELTLDHDRVQQILSDTIVEISQRGGGSTSTLDLEKLFTALRQYAQQFLTTRIGGDRHSPDEELRDGLTLSDALELEIVYRALYRSHAEEIRAKGAKAVRRVIAEYRALPEEKQIDFGELTHQDYLRDKIQRVVKEKASLLCVYDRARDQHGGVRPDHVFLATKSANFKNSNIEKALREADIAGLAWVPGDWHSAKEVIFYRAVLNVPLYTFGRMRTMKEHYESFRNLKRPSKTLHIDRDWENGLSDLDPDTLKEEHRRKLVRDQIINFAALLSFDHPEYTEGTCIRRQRGTYYLLGPGGETSNRRAERGPELTPLGETLAQAVQRLPAVLSGESVHFRKYRDGLVGVRTGLAPRLLLTIAGLPFKWRKQWENLNNHYGLQRSVSQRENLDDLRDSYLSLHQALADLLEELRNRQLESTTSGEDFSIYVSDLAPSKAMTALDDSIKVLTQFCERWSQLDDESLIPETPEGFRTLFDSLDPKELAKLLQSLGSTSRNGESPPETNENSGELASEPKEASTTAEAS
jgi:hypothetical protein